MFWLRGQGREARNRRFRKNFSREILIFANKSGSYGFCVNSGLCLWFGFGILFPWFPKWYLSGIGRKGGLLGGSKGGRARVPKGIAKLSPERRREIALLGVEARKRRKLGKV